MDKSVQEIQVEIDEINLAIRGWEVSDFRARLSTKYFEPDDYYHDFAVSAILRYDPNATIGHFGLGRNDAPWPAPVVIEMKIPEISQLPLSFEIEKITPEKSEKSIRIGFSNYLTRTPSPLSVDRINLTITSADFFSGKSGRPPFMPQGSPRSIPVQIVDEHPNSLSKMTFGQLEAWAFYDADSGEEDRVVVSGAGRFSWIDDAELLRWCTANYPRVAHVTSLSDLKPFEIPTPGLELCLYDESGFILDQSNISPPIWLPFGGQVATPERSPTWQICKQTPTQDFSAPTSYVLARTTYGGPNI